MYIVMHCGGLPFNGETLSKHGLGGSETAAYFLAKTLAARGHHVTLFTNTQNEGEWEGVRYLSAGAATEQTPLGARFHFYATNTPHDLLLVQRAPYLMRSVFASKVNLVWLHDLALRRLKPAAWNSLSNIDAVLAVSAWHKGQIHDAWGIDPASIYVAPNGLDFTGESIKPDQMVPERLLPADRINLLYTSRPERGLENLLRPGAILDRLEKTGKPYHLYVCNYENVTAELREYYGALYANIAERHNATNLGHLSKAQLEDVMHRCHALVYPSNFEETSCITAMEAAAAGLPFIGSAVGALPETTKGTGATLLQLDPKANDDSMLPGVAKGVNADRFVDTIRKLENEQWAAARTREQLDAAGRYTWEHAADAVEKAAADTFGATRAETKAQSLLRNSDIYALRELEQTEKLSPWGALRDMPYYAFAFENRFAEHYASYYQYEKDRGVNYGPESLDGNTRYNHVAGLISNTRPGARILDYGCAHGHYTVNLAKRYPDRVFVGVDLAQSNIDIARKWAADEKLENVSFYHGAADNGRIELNEGALTHSEFDTVIAAEVLEHVADPWTLADTLAQYLKPDGAMIITTPYGPWEAQGYEQHKGWRAHLHHMERDDLDECFGHHPAYRVMVAPSGHDPKGEILGSYITTYGKPTEPTRRPDYQRKLARMNPRQTLAVCMIVKDAEATLKACLDTVKGIADEIIIGVDRGTTDRTRDIATEYAKGFTDPAELVWDIPSPTETGFDAARNTVIARATADWILWIDADETLHFPEALPKYLRHNQFNAYAMAQNHFTVQPPGVMKVDYPTRLFRNYKGIRFFGVVHEHPELELNKGVGAAMLIHDALIAHNGYTTEKVRRQRFQRNISLLVRDRETYPDRKLGKFLWLRDMAQMCGYELETNGGEVTLAMRKRAEEGVRMWEQLLDAGEYRMAIDGLDFYSTCVNIATNGQGGVDIGFKLDASKLNGGPKVDAQQEIRARFARREHAERLMLGILKERTNDYESAHF